MHITTLNQVKQLKHGQRVTCTIENEDITDAKISINNYGDVHICQNHKIGARADDLLGYKYSWFITFDKVENLRTVDKTSLKDMEVEDILVDIDQNEYKVLEKLQNTFLISEKDEEDYYFWYTYKNAEEQGFTLKEQESIEQQPQEDTQEYKPKEVDEPLKIGVSEINTSSSLRKMMEKIGIKDEILGKPILPSLKEIFDEYMRKELDKMSKDQLYMRKELDKMSKDQLINMIIKRKMVE